MLFMYKNLKWVDPIAPVIVTFNGLSVFLFRIQDQFEFSLSAVAEEVNAILKALPQ